jgi:predicted TIM-barrel fold metal-dependent hydrolase
LIAEALDKFGLARLIWGSNYPVVGTRADYQADMHLLLDGSLPIPTIAIPQIAGENARRLWFA